VHQRDCRSARTQGRSVYYPLQATKLHLRETYIRELKGRGEIKSGHDEGLWNVVVFIEVRDQAIN
jgi:hypothetical protein